MILKLIVVVISLSGCLSFEAGNLVYPCKTDLKNLYIGGKEET